MEPLYWSIILLGIGIAVVVLELFVPSAGVLGVVAAVCFVSGIVLGFFSSFQAGFIMLIITLLLVPILLMVMVKIWPSTPIGRRILMKVA